MSDGRWESGQDAHCVRLAIGIQVRKSTGPLDGSHETEPMVITPGDLKDDRVKDCCGLPADTEVIRKGPRYVGEQVSPPQGTTSCKAQIWPDRSVIGMNNCVFVTATSTTLRSVARPRRIPSNAVA